MVLFRILNLFNSEFECAFKDEILSGSLNNYVLLIFVLYFAGLNLSKAESIFKDSYNEVSG